MLPFMQFRSFVWPKNPEKLSVALARDLKEFSVPFHAAVVQDFGEKKRIVSGEGEFTGERCFQVYRQLQALFVDGQDGLLILPGFSPMNAKPVSLSYSAAKRPALLRYQFAFWVLEDNLQDAFAPRVVLVGEQQRNLWDIANAYHTSVELLLPLNPHLRWLSCLTPGELVFLP